ncbi:DUF4352 domain-containing protein [Georgenia alba]|uniref:DUF4352 domain-containing protein n=1 Tax=Georgenia alba TaxID=2233858 RepID=A0ABW2Q483_9MICO
MTTCRRRGQGSRILPRIAATPLALVAAAALAACDGAGGGEETTSPPGPSPTEEAEPSPTEEAEPSPTEEAEPSPTEEAEASHGMGEPVEAGFLEVTVEDVETGVGDIGGTAPEGQFVVVHVTVTNVIDREPDDLSGQLHFMAADQAILDDGGAVTLGNDDLLSLREDAAVFYDPLMPTDTVEGVVIFDIPAGSTPEALLLGFTLQGVPDDVIRQMPDEELANSFTTRVNLS